MARATIDFTSSLYLGIRHPSRSLRPWSQLSTGKPAIFGTAPGSSTLADALAELQGCESITFLPSTLHLFFDLFEVLRRDLISLYVDQGAYPIARWGAERVAAHGVPFREIPHFDPEAACRMIRADEAVGLQPIILADGFCPDCGRFAPLRGYLQCIGQYDGFVILDDTQALGIWGASRNRMNPYGSDGGGSLRYHGLQSRNVVVGNSLAKAFGVPLAALGGSAQFVRRFLRRSDTRVHASPPSIAALRAAEHALRLNAERGDDIRRRLATRVERFRDGMRRAGLCGNDSTFPVQMLVPERADPERLHGLLHAAGIRTALVRTRTTHKTKLVFVITAAHTAGEIDRAIRATMTAMTQLMPDHGA